MTPSLKRLKTLATFSMTARQAVDKLHDQYLTRSHPIDSENFLKLIRDDLWTKMEPLFEGNDQAFYKRMKEMMERLVAHIYVSHHMMVLAYDHAAGDLAKTGTYIHNSLIQEARTRIEVELEKIIEAAARLTTQTK